MLASALGLGLLGSGCSEPSPPRLVPRLGCGVDDDLLNGLRVHARGDFPASSNSQLLFSGGEGALAWGDLEVEAVTVEGLFGQTVEAVGRTARLRDEGELPVYFAPVDGLCPVQSEGEVAPRWQVAASVGPMGDVVVVGGRDEEGRLLDEVLHLHDEEGRLSQLGGGLPLPSVGHSVHAIGERRFVVVGGATGSPDALDYLVVIDLNDERDPVGEPRSLSLELEDGPARAFHAAARLPGDRILVAGGCRSLNSEAECAVGDAAPSEGADPDELPIVHPNSLWVDPRGSSLEVTIGPDLSVPRYGAQLLVARDGVAFLVGGWDAAGDPVHIVERLRPDTNRFRRYGGDPRDDLPEDLAVVGAALHEGGFVVVVLADGRIHWLTEDERDEYRPWGGWCEGEGACFADLQSPAPAITRGAVTLPGERVLIDGLLLPIAGIGRSEADVVDLFASRPGEAPPPPLRVGALSLVLADKSVLMIGGHAPETGALANPVALRLRPALDGPDEEVPEVDRAAPGSLVARDPERAVLDGETLRLLALESSGGFFPRVRAHARGFRSTSFRFEVTVQVTSGGAVPHVVLEHGAVEGMSISLERDRIIGHFRDPQGRIQDVSCAGSGLDFSETQVLRVEVRPEAVELRQEGQVIAQCPVVGGARAWSVGIGAAGSGEVLVFGLRLTRV